MVCAKKAKMPLFESVLMLFEDMQSIQSGLSGFGSEIVQFQKALDQAEQGYSLFLLDEFARGTNPDEGAVIVQAVTKYLNGIHAISLLTTHYDKVADCGRAHYQIIGLRDIDPEAIRRELAVSGEDGIRVIARHMNYGLYRVEGKSDCPRDAPEHLPDAVAEAGDPASDRGKLLRKRDTSAAKLDKKGRQEPSFFVARNNEKKLSHRSKNLLSFFLTISLDKLAEWFII